MKAFKILFFIAIISLTSCSQKTYVISDFNMIGKVEKKRQVNNCESGDYKYSVRVDPETKFWIILDDDYSVGDSVWVKCQTKVCLYR